MPRHSRRLSESKIYHIVIRGNERMNIFLDDDDKARFIHTLYEKCANNLISIYAFCLMDNHVHLLLNEGNDQISRIMKRINVSYASYFNKKYGRIGHLFQDRFKSEAIENDQYLLAAVRYIHNNPVKAGIVDNPMQYKWSSVHLYIAQTSQGSNVTTDYILDMLSQNRERAISIFIDFSVTSSNEIEHFIDYQPEERKANKEIQQVAMQFIEEYLQANDMKLDEINHVLHIAVRQDLIKKLKVQIGLSIRQIAELLKVDRNVVQRIK